MSKPDKWIDPRTPVSVTQIGKWKLTVYDQAAYDASLKQYPDDNEKPQIAKADNVVSQFKKGKPAARYRWTRKLETPLPVGTMDTFTGKEA